MKVRLRMHQVIPDVDGYYYIVKLDVSKLQYNPLERHLTLANAQAQADQLDKELEEQGQGPIIIDWDVKETDSE